MFPRLYRSVNNRPVSQVLSSQVTNTSDTSPDIAVQLTFNYSVDVSSFVHAVTCKYNTMTLYTRVMILCRYVAFGTFHLMKEGMCSCQLFCMYNHAWFYRGGWDTEGVSVMSIDMDSSIITCNSTHLTSFAVLVDVSGGHQVTMLSC